MKARIKLEMYFPFEIITKVCSYLTPEEIARLLFLDQYFCQTVLKDKHALWESKFSIHFPLAYQKLKKNEKEIDWKNEFWKLYNIECKHINKKLLVQRFLQENKKDITPLPAAKDIMRLFSYAKEGHYSKFIEKFTAFNIQDIDTFEFLLQINLENTNHGSLLDCIHENDLSNLMLDHIYAIAQALHDDENEMFKWACRCQQPKIVFNKILKKGTLEVNQWRFAASEGCINAIDVAFANNLHTTNKNFSDFLLYSAASNGQVGIINLIYNLDTITVESTTNVLCQAVRYGELDAVKLLLTKNADVRNVTFITHSSYTTMLSMCVSFVPKHYNFVHIIKLLLENNVDINVVNNDGETVLHSAMYLHEKHFEVISLFLNHADEKNKINIEATTNSGDTPLHIATELGYFLAVQLLLDKGANVNATNQLNKTPLDLAIDKNNFEIIDLLLKKQAPVTHVLFNRALQKGDEKIIKGLLPAVIDIAFTDAKQNNLLHLAIQFNSDITVIQSLIRKGCDINAINSAGLTPLALSKRNGYSDFKKLKEFIINLTKNKDSTQNRFFTITRNEKQAFEEKLGKSAIEYKKK